MGFIGIQSLAWSVLRYCFEDYCRTTFASLCCSVSRRRDLAEPAVSVLRIDLESQSYSTDCLLYFDYLDSLQSCPAMGIASIWMAILVEPSIQGPLDFDFLPLLRR